MIEVDSDLYRPWHLSGKGAVKDYVSGLGSVAHQWLLALYVDGNLDLLATEKIAQGGVSVCRVPLGRILTRGQKLKAEAFILVHNQPSGDPTLGPEDIQATRRLSDVSEECGLPMLAHLIISGDKIRTISSW